MFVFESSRVRCVLCLLSPESSQSPRKVDGVEKGYTDAVKLHREMEKRKKKIRSGIRVSVAPTTTFSCRRRRPNHRRLLLQSAEGG